MPRIPGTSNQQTAFLRAFRTHPNGPPPELWPSPAILRRWMSRPTFVKTIDSLLQAVRLQTDCHLAFAACHAARQTAQSAAAPLDPAAPALKPPDPNQLLRLHHLRQRFPAHTAPNGKSAQAPNQAPAKQEEDLPDRPHVFYPIMEDPERRRAYKTLLHLRNRHRWDHLFDKYDITHPAPNPTPCPEQATEPHCH